METTLTQVSPVEYTWTLHVPADELKPQVDKALNKQRKRADLEGFRKGRVPLSLFKARFGEAIGFTVAEQFVQDTFADEMEARDDLNVLGRPRLTDFDYEVDGDLDATIRFGVRPGIEIKDLSDEQLPRLAVEVTEEDIDEELEDLRKREADLMPVDDGAAEPTDWVLIDLQRIDEATNTPIIGEKEEDLAFFLDDDRLHDELREALIGKTLDDIFRVDLAGDPEGEGEAAGTRRYEVTIHEIKRRDLPELDEEFIKDVTDGEFEDPAIFRHEVRYRLEQDWEERSDELLYDRILDRMLELHPIPVPPAVVDMVLDSYVRKLVARSEEDELPEGFDMTAFRQQFASEAERQGRWVLIRDEIIAQEDLEVSEAERDAFFADIAKGLGQQVTADQLKQYYMQSPGMLDQLEQNILDEKVFGALKRRFDLQDKTIEEYEALMQEEEEAKAAVSPLAGPGAGSPTSGLLS
jgi:trigger factor